MTLLPPQLDTTDLIDHLLVPRLKEHQLVALIHEISDGLTRHRESLKSQKAYFMSPELVSAYALFYLPTNMPKLDFLLKQLPGELLERILASTLVDMGTGPGTFAFAFAQHAPGARVLGLDSSPLMVEQARKLARALGPACENMKFAEHGGLPLKQGEGERTLLFGHSLNEMGTAECLRWIREIDPEVVLFLEPGTPAVFQLMLELRPELSARGYHCAYPCAHGDRPCPIAARPGDWCHQIVRTTHAPGVERLAQLVRLDRHHMPLLAHAYSKTRPRASGEVLVRFGGESKFAWEWDSCRAEKGENTLEHLLFMHKDVKSEDKKRLHQTSVGERVELERTGQRKDGAWKVKFVGEK